MLYTELLNTLKSGKELTAADLAEVANFCFDFDPYGVLDYYGDVRTDDDARKAYIEGITSDLKDPEIKNQVIEMLIFTIEKCNENAGTTTFYANEF